MKRYDVDAVDRLYALAWGDSIHFGLYGDGVQSISAATRAAKNAMVEAAELSAGKDVLEVGSGWGATARYLADVVGCRVLATNYSFRQAEIAARICAPQIAAGKIRLAMADFHALPFDDSCFDTHWSQECMVHATDKARVFSEAFRVLRPGGRIVFSEQTTDVTRLSADERQRIVDRHGSDDLWSRDDFTHAIRSAGFKGVRAVDWTANMARHFAELVRRIDRADPSELDGIDDETLNHNRAMWQWGAELGSDARIGWAMFVGTKPA